MPAWDSEVIIIGGGIAGNTIAGLLGSKGIECIIIEAGKGEGSRIDERVDPRALAITIASRQILQGFDLWRRIPEARIGRFRRMQVWDENGSGDISFDSADLSQPLLGYIIEQSILQQTLVNVLNYIPAVKVLTESTPEALSWDDAGVTVQLNGQRRLRARLVVAADGVHSRTRELGGIAYHTHDYRQTALACVVKTALPHGDVARQRFLKDGPLAFLPMFAEDQCGIVWSTSPAHAQQLLEMAANEFNGSLGKAFAHKVGEIVESGPRGSFPLRRAQAERYCKERLVLIGDAAHCVHPLAGQGANLGLLDAASLAQVLLDAKERGKDFARLPTLRRYERWRKGENRMMMMVLEGFKYLFENQTGPIPLLRNAGLDLFDTVTPLKHWIMRRAMGLEGDLPAVARCC